MSIRRKQAASAARADAVAVTVFLVVLAVIFWTLVL